MTCMGRCIVTLVAFFWLFSTVYFHNIAESICPRRTSMFFFSLQALVVELLHKLQLWDLFPPCWIMCILRFFFILKERSHWGHEKGVSSAFIFMVGFQELAFTCSLLQSSLLTEVKYAEYDCQNFSIPKWNFKSISCIWKHMLRDHQGSSTFQPSQSPNHTKFINSREQGWIVVPSGGL